MNKIILFLLFLSTYSYGQTCQQTFTVSGFDNAPTVLTIENGDIDCYLGEMNSIVITNAVLGLDNLCNQSYYFSVNIDGVVSNKCAQDLIGLDVSNFQSIQITSANIGGWSSNNVTLSVTFAVGFTTVDVPYCDAVLLSPEDNSSDVSATGKLSWSQATGATGYRLTVGTSFGSGEVLDMVDVGNVMTYDIPGLLEPLTTYYVSILPYNINGDAVEACNAYTFTTCAAFDNLTENFDGLQTNEVPTCWSIIRNTSDDWASINFYGDGVGLYNSGDLSATLLLVTPSLPSLANGTHRLKFKASSFSAGFTLLVGTMSDPSDASTFTTVQTISTNNVATDYNIVFDTPSTDRYIAFKHGLGGLYRTINLDSFVWEEVASEAPGCIEADIEIISDDNCGNFVNKLVWEPVLFADGYRLTMGTSEGSNDVIDNLDLGSATSYSFNGLNNTEYYFTITPYNTIGSATGCMEYGFVTATNACYCVAVPDQGNFEGSGITNIQLGNSSINVPPVSYSDLTSNTSVEFYQALNASLKITFATGYTYDTHVWIDFNDDSTFSENERVFSGESSFMNPTVFDASFQMPDDATVGLHRMRIASANYGQQTPNPCYNGPYGVNIDVSVYILPVPSCLPPTALSVANIGSDKATLHWVSDGSAFNIEYYSNLGFVPGEGILLEGVEGDSYQLASLEAQTSYEYYVQRDCGEDNSPWFGPFLFTTACSPFGAFNEDFNNVDGIPECWYSIVDSSNPYATVNVSPFGKNVYMTNSSDSEADLLLVTPILTDLPNGTHRVKFKARAGFNGQQLLIGTMTDPQDSSTFTLAQTVLLTSTLSEYVVEMNQPGDGLHLAFKHGLGGGFRDIFIDDFVWEENQLKIGAFDNESFRYYPNPVKENLNVSYSEEIINIEIFNLLGQQLMNKHINSTQGNIDLSAFPTGNYLLKVTASNGTKVIKIAKM